MGRDTPAAPENRPQLYPLHYETVIRRALSEDLGEAGDRTTDSIIPAAATAHAVLRARAPGRVAGLEAALYAFRLLDPDLAATVHATDGSDVEAGETIATLAGRARAILTGERTALNLLSRLCGIASAARDAQAACAGTAARVVCTRKTTPGLRALEKYAVRMGGAGNHRFGLGDALLIKDNHIAVAGGITAAVAAARQAAGHMAMLEVEVDTLAQLDEALALKVPAILLDNMSPDQLRRAVEKTAGRAVLEASGGITPDRVAEVAATGVDLISLGWLTHSAKSLDIGLDISIA